ncbi:hypothetical protein Plhal304r1_c011g0041741 [Plasmopara halstedii]
MHECLHPWTANSTTAVSQLCPTHTWMRYDCWIVNIVCHVESKLRRIRNTEATDSVLRVMVDQLVDHFKLLLLLDVKPELFGTRPHLSIQWVFLIRLSKRFLS